MTRSAAAVPLRFGRFAARDDYAVVRQAEARTRDGVADGLFITADAAGRIGRVVWRGR